MRDIYMKSIAGVMCESIRRKDNYICVEICKKGWMLTLKELMLMCDEMGAMDVEIDTYLDELYVLTFYER